jgi:hypothetical protein
MKPIITNEHNNNKYNNNKKVGAGTKKIKLHVPGWWWVQPHFKII